MGCKTQKKGNNYSWKVRISLFHLLFLLILCLFSFPSCSQAPRGSVLLRDYSPPPLIVQESFSRQGKSDFFLLNDEGYSFRLIYLCENRVLNFIEEPKNNPLLVSIQPILDTSVEKKLSPDDRRRVWACIERTVWEQQSRVAESTSRLVRERIRAEEELAVLRAEKEKILAEISEKRRLDQERQRRLEQEKRRAEEERLKRVAEEQRKIAEEERKVRYYRTGQKFDLVSPAPPPPPQPKITESGIFMVMKETSILEEPREKSRAVARAGKYDLFDVINSAKDEKGGTWYQVVVGERTVLEKGKKVGWSPEEKSFWVKNKLLAWVYPGDITNINNIIPLKIRPDDLLYTGKTATTAQKIVYHEVTWGTNTTYREEIYGWVEGNEGIRRSTKNKAEMRDLLKDLSKTMWPIRIQEDILRGYIRQGFSREQVVLSWGRPDHVNTTRTLVGVHEQWVYGEPPFPKSYVYFENGVVKNWEFLRESGS